MDTITVETPQPCAAVIAEFVWGPQRCNEPTTLVETYTGDNFPVCPEHASL